jgi:hypothetical protein
MSGGFASPNYVVARSRGCCAVSNLPIEPGEAFMAALRESAEGYERIDVKLDHWTAFDRSDIVGFWKAHMPTSETKKRTFVDDATLCDLFERLGDADDRGKASFRFVLGLILIRKRLLSVEATARQPDHDIWRVRLRGREETIDLIDPRPTDNEVAGVQQQLQQVLSEGA